ncbi:hypothetical protein [Microbacterium sp.]|uniref:hypothetical protein n=1 Tax=Microbacterium sp. TaxID=51671 RepID=UPI002811E4C5|nr:hypothetical protein [Microbacterium sp.]
MAQITVKPFVMRDCTLNIKDGATDVGDFELHVSKVEITPNASVQVWKGLTPAAVYQDVAQPEWTANIDYAQDWETVNSFSQYSLANVGKKVTAKFTPKKGTGAKSITVTVTILPGSIGGTVGAFATGSVALPVDGQPVLA